VALGFRRRDSAALGLQDDRLRRAGALHYTDLDSLATQFKPGTRCIFGGAGIPLSCSTSVFTVHGLQYATTRREAAPLYATLIVTTACVLPPAVAAIHVGHATTWRSYNDEPVGKPPGRSSNTALLTDSEWVAVVLGRSERLRSMSSTCSMAAVYAYI
jgi:hypothetical protein